MSEPTSTGGDAPRQLLHPVPIRIMHWTNAISMIVMIMSGWKINNDEVLFGWLHFPEWITLGDGAEGALQWHFVGMWILTANAIVYAIYGCRTARFRRMLFPIKAVEVIAEVRRALQLKLHHDDLTTYNPVQKLLYLGVLMVAVVQVLSGLLIWKPVQFSELTFLFYDFQGARLAHFIGMAAIVGFMIVHVALAFLVPETLVAMITGGPKLPADTVDRPASATAENAVPRG